MPIVLISLLGVLAALFLLLKSYKWLVVPFRVGRRQRTELTPTFEQVTPDLLTPEMREFIAAVLREFAAEGFEAAAHVYHSKQGSRVTVSGTSLLLVNRRTGDVANVVTTSAGHRRSLVYGVRSDFADRKSIVTAHSRDIGIFPRDPDIDGTSVSWTREVAALLEFHRRRVERAGRANEPRVTPPPGGEIAYMKQEWERTMSRLIRLGYYYVDPQTGELRQTIKGCYLLAWRIMEPVKSFRIRRRDREARDEWHALGMDEWRSVAPPPPIQTPAGPVAAAAPASDEAGLRYETRLAVREIRGERTPAGLTVRVGMPMRAGALAANWRTVLSLVIFCMLLAATVYTSWVQYTMMMRFGPTFAPSYSIFGIWFYALLVIVALDVFKLVRTLVFARGTVVLAASPAGLAYQNVPAWSPNGTVIREDVDSLLVGYVAGIFRREYQLKLRRRGSMRMLTLFSGRDKAAMERVRSDLAVALGIERVRAENVRPAEPSTPPTTTEPVTTR
jgi:hypothetical protein